jgi:DNA-binding response OmpR family regulator
MRSMKYKQMAEKVLVVDDARGIRDLLSELLEGEGYQVILASNGNEALELAETENLQAILLDINMPGINGVEVCKRLREGESTRSVPVIMMAALGDHKTKAFEARADDFVIKPFDLTDIKVRVKSLIRAAHLTDPAERLTAYMEELEKKP